MTLRTKNLIAQTVGSVALIAAGISLIAGYCTAAIPIYMLVAATGFLLCVLHRCPSCSTRLPFGEQLWFSMNVKWAQDGWLGRPGLPRSVRCPQCESPVE